MTNTAYLWEEKKSLYACTFEDKDYINESYTNLCKSPLYVLL